MAEKTEAATTKPRIYVASLSDYNAGRLHGAWLDASDLDAVEAGIARMLASSPEPGAEEFAIHDFEGFGSYRLDEYESIPFVCSLAAAIAKHGTLFADYLGHVGHPKDSSGLADARVRFEESYQGDFDSLADWAESFLEDTGALGDVPASLRNYIDFESWADDAEMNGDIFAVQGHGGDRGHGGHEGCAHEGCIHVFWSR